MGKINLLCILVAIMAITFTSCEHNESDFTVQSELLSSKLSAEEIDVLFRMRNGKSNKISLEEATQIAHEVIGFLEDETIIKVRASRKIGKITTLRNSQTKRTATESLGETVEMPDTLAYIFNFADSAGYTIIAADTRVETPILCYTDRGTLCDSIDNAGLAVFLTGAEFYIERSIVEAQQMRDSLIADILAKIDQTGIKDTIYLDESNVPIRTTPMENITIEPQIAYSYGPWQVDTRVGPLLPVEWGQHAPYNKLIKYYNCSSGTSPTGCVATATAQIMAYWGHPNYIGNYTFNWNVLRRYTAIPNRYYGAGILSVNAYGAEADFFRQQVASIMERIGYYIDMDYYCDRSSADDGDAVDFLHTLGFSGGNKQNYNGNTVISSLNNTRPIMIGGYSTKKEFLGISFLYTLSGGHTWVIDGYLRMKRVVTITVRTEQIVPELSLPHGGTGTSGRQMLIYTTTTTTTTEYSPYYLHNNWGWDGDRNGYYVAGSFNTNNGADYNSNTRSSEPHNYQFNIEMFPNIYYP